MPLFSPPTPPDPAALAQDWALEASPGHLDELREPDSERLRPHWADFFRHVGLEGMGELNRRAQSLARQIRDNGVTYNVYADAAQGMQRPWSLDLLPTIITPESWASIEAGVLQRTRLLNLIMADIYGPRELLRRSLLPPALIQGHPGYLRALHGVQPLGDTWLNIAAFDLARGVAAHPGPVRPGLPARKPHRHCPPVSQGLHGHEGAAPGRQLPGTH